MIKAFRINYAENKKFNPMTRSTLVSVESEDEIGIDAKHALSVFTSVVGSLKKYNIISMQELDAAGNQVGEDIVPDEETSVLPSATKTKVE